MPATKAIDDQNGDNKSRYAKGQTWGALKKAWKGYRIAKVQNDEPNMKKYSQRIMTLQDELGLPQTQFKGLSL
jgi:hypothetical protein